MFPNRPDTLLEWALAGAGATTFIVFAVALQNFFVQPPLLTRGQRLFQDLSVLFAVTHGFGVLALNTAGDIWVASGIALYGLSMALFLSALEAARGVSMTRAFIYEPKCATFPTEGPYRVIRHPIYLSYSLAWCAVPIATLNLFLALTALVMIACYVISARTEERLIADGKRGADYVQWQRKTWRMIPYVY